ncbi:MAG: aminoacyl-tRNA hydrolase [Deltaproteobacteria bacterium]|nr:aminoacyl-tRNA hydrolase [Deltaproteobacteria bacterium]
MLLIVGLGNPGPGYEHTRHNAGFLALGRLAAKAGFPPPARFRQSLAAKGTVAGTPAVLAWPQTFMNLSGRAVLEAASFYKIQGPDILVLHDEMDLSPGRLKLAFGGGAAGHRGLASILEYWGEDFCRLKIGIGRPAAAEAADYVLDNFSSREWPLVEETLDRAAEAALAWAAHGLGLAQNLVNRRTGPADGRPEQSADV